jgi:amino acid transporter
LNLISMTYADLTQVAEARSAALFVFYMVVMIGFVIWRDIAKENAQKNVSKPPNYVRKSAKGPR